MSIFVLVHGAWHGSWCWQRVRSALQQRGHTVFTPTLSGVGERSHLLAPSITLETHIADVANLIAWEQLDHVVLCGHSYAGCVISGVADRMPERIAALVYLDAFVLEDGECLYDLLPPGQRELQQDLADRHGDGWKVPPIPAAAFNVNAVDRDWVDRQCTVQPIATFRQRLQLSAAAATVPLTVYVLAEGWAESPFPQCSERAMDRGWTVQTIDSGHDVMLDRPAELTDMLARIAAACRTP